MPSMPARTQQPSVYTPHLSHLVPLPSEQISSLRCSSGYCPGGTVSPSESALGRTLVYAPSTAELHMDLSSFGEPDGSLDFNSLELLTTTDAGTSCAAIPMVRSCRN